MRTSFGLQVVFIVSLLLLGCAEPVEPDVARSSCGAGARAHDATPTENQAKSTPESQADRNGQSNSSGGTLVPAPPTERKPDPLTPEERKRLREVWADELRERGRRLAQQAQEFKELRRAIRQSIENQRYLESELKRLDRKGAAGEERDRVVRELEEEQTACSELESRMNSLDTDELQAYMASTPGLLRMPFGEGPFGPWRVGGEPARP